MLCSFGCGRATCSTDNACRWWHSLFGSKRSTLPSDAPYAKEIISGSCVVKCARGTGCEYPVWCETHQHSVRHVAYTSRDVSRDAQHVLYSDMPLSPTSS